MDFEATVKRVSLITVIANAGLAVLKLAAGLLAHSGAMVSDAVNSATDVFSTFVVLVGAKLSVKAADADHAYGHERYESIAALILAAIVFATGIGIGYGGVSKIAEGVTPEAAPGVFALVAAAVSIVVKEILYRYTVRHAKRVNSVSLLAAAWDHRSDVLGTAGAFAGILGARLGLPVLDALASVVICVFIVKTACGIFAEAAGKLTDKACDSETEKGIRQTAFKQPGVLAVDVVHTRIFGQKAYADVEISADGNLTLYEAHAIAEKVHAEVERAYPTVKHCMVHVNPVVGEYCVVGEEPAQEAEDID